MSQNNKDFKPFTTPPGYRPPTLAECWKYFYKQHPYYRYGYSAVIVLGIVGYLASDQRKETHPPVAKNMRDEDVDNHISSDNS
jgi:hypothetical protein